MDIIREARRQHTERAMREAEERAERQARERQYRRLRDLRGKRKALPENIWAATGLANPGQARQGDQGRKFPYAIAITPNGKTAYVLDYWGAHVTPISTVTNTALQAIKVAASHPTHIAISPDGKTAYVVSSGSTGTVTPIRTATNTAVRAINAGSRPGGVAITP